MHWREGYIDLSRRAGACRMQSEGSADMPASKRSKLDGSAHGFGWDNVLVLTSTNKTYGEMLRDHGIKVSPRDVNINRYIMDCLHYTRRKATKWIRQGFEEFVETVSFREEDSVGAFVQQQEHINNTVACKSGLRNVFIAVANHGAFFRSARTRREVNYWLPGLNAGIPFVAKPDPIHEITFTAHDFGHFLIPDLVYTGHNSELHARVYILYRMMSEATTMIFADMLFVETLRRSGYQYDWTKRKINPLLLATGLDPFEAADKNAFFSDFRTLLEANVAYCLLGDNSKWLTLVKNNPHGSGLDSADGTSCKALDEFCYTYMPFFVEDYNWTSANHANMSRRHEEFSRWWALVAPLVADAGIGSQSIGGSGGSLEGIGLETVSEFIKAIGVREDEAILPTALIPKIFERVFETRIKPVLQRSQPLLLAPADVRRTRSFVRYLVGQSMLFERFAFVPDVAACGRKILSFVQSKVRSGGTISDSEISSVRGLYHQCLRTLHARSLITPDDVDNWAQIFPLFDPVYVSYNKEWSSYERLADVQARILGVQRQRD
eukprot:gnl/MRDRNA2_/MRDRNA2_16638_c0_seq1.p1 gnl/MRDRNA2_/MRDRNA2_16638_c0~~gnl/MRDRNA2_/MRDRNA2_16638_c0_seq1.p1  ORF type:complete len:550 (-),score=74.07 gnl/MRDRNA2_/MRDRNA2_16638_c0_seq1:125-1774(-)